MSNQDAKLDKISINEINDNEWIAVKPINGIIDADKNEIVNIVSLSVDKNEVITNKIHFVPKLLVIKKNKYFKIS